MANTSANRKAPRKSPRKSPRESPKTLKAAEHLFQFTGQARLILELRGYGPMEIRIDDLDTSLALLRTILDNTGHVFDVNAYNDVYAERLRELFSDG